MLCSSYSGDTEETIACFEAAEARGRAAIVASTGGGLVEAARRERRPVIGLPGLIPAPRFGVAYMFVCAAEVAALAGVAPRIATEIEAAATFLEASAEDAPLARRGDRGRPRGRLPVIYGADLTARSPRAGRPRSTRTRSCRRSPPSCPRPTTTRSAAGRASGDRREDRAVLLEDAGQHPRVAPPLRADRGGDRGRGDARVRVEARGREPLERLLWTVMLGDLVSPQLARGARRRPAPDRGDRAPQGRPRGPLTGRAGALAPTYPSPDHRYERNRWQPPPQTTKSPTSGSPSSGARRSASPRWRCPA